MRFFAKLKWAAAALPRAGAQSTLIPKASGDCHQDTALEHSTRLFNPIPSVLTYANLSGTIWIHISSASLRRIQPVVPSHQRTPVLHVSIQIMHFSLWFSPQHTLGTFWLPQSWKLGVLRTEGTAMLKSAKSAFAPSLWKAEEVLENPWVSDILGSTQHH